MEQRCIAITGASSGMGAALAREYAAAGTQLHICGRNEDRLSAVAADCQTKGAEVITSIFDITDRQAAQNWIDAITQPLDLLIANAGLGHFQYGDKIEEAADTGKVVDVNLKGYANVVAPAAKKMQRQKNGQIALISSLASLQPLTDSPGYAASKAGVNAYGESMGYFLYQDNITVSVVLPGFIETPLTDPQTNWRPFQFTAEKAARKIRRALVRKKRFYAFPMLLVWNIWLGRVSPWHIRRIAIKVFCQ
jgi:short-subunit dehydrogenase